MAYAAAKLGIGRLTIFDIDRDRSQTLAKEICARFGEGRAAAGTDITAAIAAADGLINATPIGMAGHPGMPVSPDLLREALWVSDVIYFPLETELLRTARSLGCRTLDGGGMAVFQAAEAFSLFTNQNADTARMLRHFTTMGA